MRKALSDGSRYTLQAAWEGGAQGVLCRCAWRKGQEGGLALGETLGGAAACCSDLSSVDSRRDLLCRIDSHLLLSP